MPIDESDNKNIGEPARTGLPNTGGGDTMRLRVRGRSPKGHLPDVPVQFAHSLWRLPMQQRMVSKKINIVTQPANPYNAGEVNRRNGIAYW